jgi:hypothetical protein
MIGNPKYVRMALRILSVIQEYLADPLSVVPINSLNSDLIGDAAFCILKMANKHPERADVIMATLIQVLPNFPTETRSQLERKLCRTAVKIGLPTTQPFLSSLLSLRGRTESFE